MHQPEAVQAFRSYAEKMEGNKVRVRSDSFADHFSQARLFWNSMADWEKAHIVNAVSFELNQCTNEAVRSRALNEIMVNIHEDLAAGVSDQIGIAVKPPGTAKNPTPSAPTPSGPLKKHDNVSPALSMDKPAGGIKGRKVAVLAGDGVDAAQLAAAKDALMAEGALVEIVAAKAGSITCSNRKKETVNRAAPNAASVLYDAVVVPGGKSAAALAESGVAIKFVQEAFHHGKPIAAMGDGEMLLEATHLTEAGAEQGVLIGDDLVADFIEAMKMHRFRNRDVSRIPA